MAFHFYRLICTDSGVTDLKETGFKAKDMSNKKSPQITEK